MTSSTVLAGYDADQALRSLRWCDTLFPSGFMSDDVAHAAELAVTGKPGEVSTNGRDPSRELSRPVGSVCWVWFKRRRLRHRIANVFARMIAFAFGCAAIRVTFGLIQRTTTLTR